MSGPNKTVEVPGLICLLFVVYESWGSFWKYVSFWKYFWRQLASYGGNLRIIYTETLVAPRHSHHCFHSHWPNRLPVQDPPFSSGSGVLLSLCQTVCGAPELCGFLFCSGALGLICLSWGVPGPGAEG